MRGGRFRRRFVASFVVFAALSVGLGVAAEPAAAASVSGTVTWGGAGSIPDGTVAIRVCGNPACTSAVVPDAFVTGGTFTLNLPTLGSTYSVVAAAAGSLSSSNVQPWLLAPPVVVNIASPPASLDFTVDVAVIAATVNLPSGVSANTAIHACVAPQVPIRESLALGGRVVCSGGGTLRTSGYGPGARRVLVSPGPSYNVAANGFTADVLSTVGPQPLVTTAAGPFSVPAGGDIASTSFDLGAASGSVVEQSTGVGFPFGITQVELCATSLALGDVCSDPLWRMSPTGPTMADYRVLLPAGTYHVAPTMGGAVATALPIVLTFPPGSPTSVTGQGFSVPPADFATITAATTVNGGGSFIGLFACRNSPVIQGCATLRNGQPVSGQPTTTRRVYLSPGTWHVTSAASYAGVFSGGPTPPTVYVLSGGESPSVAHTVNPPPQGAVSGSASLAGYTAGNAVAIQYCPIASTPGSSCVGATNIFLNTSPTSYSQAVAPGVYQVWAGWFPTGVNAGPPAEATSIATVTVVDGESITCDFAFSVTGTPAATNSCATGSSNPDGVSDAIEKGVAGGDGNHDGIPDWRQANVTSLPSDGGTGAYVTVASPAGTTLTAVSTSPDPGTAPVALPFGLVGFSLTGVSPGATVTVNVYVPGGTTPLGYWKYLDGPDAGTAPDTWVDFSSHAVITPDGAGHKVALTLTDWTGGAPGPETLGDDDPTPGVIHDPGNVTDEEAPQFQASGFFAPVDMDKPNAARAGQTIPVKWRLLDAAGAPVADPTSIVSVDSVGAGCSPDAPDAIETYASADSVGVRYLGDGYWQFNWRTAKGYAGQCRVLTVTLVGGITISAEFAFK